MIGARLCGLLADLGYERWQTLDPDSFEWPLQYEETRPLLEWLCCNLRPSNVLTVAEVAQYNELVEEGKVLDGEDLDFAYDSISAFAHRRTNQEAVLGGEESVKDIKEATEVYRAEALKLQKRIRYLQANFDSLTSHTTSLVQGRRARAAASSANSEQFLVIEEKLANRNLELNAVLEKISSSAKELSYYHSGEEDGIYLSFGDFRAFTAQDQACTNALNEWFVKQFDVGPSRLVVEEGQPNGGLSGNIDEDGKPVAKGDSERKYQSRVAELQRLRSIFWVSERQWVEAQVQNAKHNAILAACKTQAATDQHRIQYDMNTLRRRQSEVESEIAALAETEQKLMEQVIPGQCLELAKLQDTYILQGDYDLKVMRQEHYIAQQIKFINLLTGQLSRHRFLQICCQLERKQIDGAYDLLRLIETDLQRFCQATSGRIERHTVIRNAAADMQEQGAVDDQDTFVHRVRDILNIHAPDQGGGSRMYVSALGLVQKINQLHSEKQSLQAALNHSLPEDKSKCLNDMCDVIHQMQQLLFASSTTAEPVLSPWPLMKELAEMEVVNSKLSAAIEEVTRQHREKAEIVKHHPHEVGRERQVFIDFFQNPDRLRNLVRELTLHVKALRS